MKNLKNIYILCAVVIGLTSCKKTFLNELPPSSLPVTTSIKTEGDLADAVSGMYATLRSINSFGGNIPIIGDELADNTYVSSSNSGYYLPEENYVLISTNAEASQIYSQCYYSILQANRILYANVPASNNVSQLKGEAYAARALNYLTLVNIFAGPATVSATAPGVPIVTVPEFVSGPFIKPARASVGAVYKQIISDLDSAYAMMPVAGTTLHPTSSDYISKYAAKAIESRAYLYEGDYTNAITAALLVVQNGGYTLTPPTNLVAYWNNPASITTKVETIFELELNLATNNGFQSFDNFYNQGGYGQNLVYQALYNQYSATDARKNLFIVNSATAPSRPGAVILNKWINTLNATDRDNVKIIRYAEVLLTLAEAYARTGDDFDAQTYVNMVAQKRDPAFIGYISTGTQLASDIVTERQKELVGEGFRWFDVNRLQLPINRPVQAGSYTYLASIPVTDYRRIFPIPQAETDANKNTTQNPGY
ncbi:MAG: starch-binding outer membrane protein SusD/RagB family [Mucilaginibacter sp.]|nr:starch-binding outer membrane protein SusD/RagB family [Mucilaginibacter sp.]